MSVAYDIKPSDGEAPIMLEFWGIWSTLSLPSLPVTLWSGVVALDIVLFRGQIELFDVYLYCVQTNNLC